MIKRCLLSMLLILFSMTLHVSKAHAFFGLFGDSNVEMVRGGTFSFDNSITLGDALEGNQFFYNPDWESFQDSQKRQFVQVTVDINMDLLSESIKAPVKLMIQFVINKDESFEPTYLAYITEFDDKLYEPRTVDQIYQELEVIYQNSISQIAQKTIIGGLNLKLAKCIDDSNIELIKYFIQHGTDINKQKDNRYNISLFMRAVEKNKIDMVVFLLKKGANIKETDIGDTALNKASSQGNLEMMQVLIDNGAQVDGEKGKISPLFKAYSNYKEEAVELLLKNGADVNQKDRHGQSLLTRSIYQNKKFEFIKLLVKYGADVNSEDGSKTPVLNTIENGYADRQEQLKFLLDNGADVNYHSSKINETPLLSAVKRDKLALVKILLQYGADPTYKDSKGKSILDHARSQKVKQLLEEAIESKKADVSNNQSQQETNPTPPTESKKTDTSKFRNIKSKKR